MVAATHFTIRSGLYVTRKAGSGDEAIIAQRIALHVLQAARMTQRLEQRTVDDRKRLFVDLFGWDVPVADDAYEVDQFDTAHTRGANKSDV